ncbi:hypothetical protein P153DRAFT_364926 [Dothidotthia symphoricarpi CBS 119687]|uniref:Uncharacterized protein n=1 Tax=Dothidotthia symphoricarpi CBS 119687 TaxID=1392245 RepID=A0A6A6AHA7_9PLEO|nr:uncharacterized protein P153DRAFT_364926 [Dothidotthia symphoricarpi CBS 119687]KAF2131329.1 hypothetical protein P153DRAFT_364926 [Dothidotthia symphoricarpi CBS 119687]
MFALPTVNPSTSTTPPGDTTVMDTVAKSMPDTATLSVPGDLPGMPFCPQRSNTHTPFAGLDLPTLKAQQNFKRQELRTVEQTEVLQASHQSEAWRAGMIEKKRCLIVELDGLRKQITTFENNGTAPMQANTFQGSFGAAPGSVPMPSFVPQAQPPVAQPMYALSTANPYASMMMYPPPFGTFPSFPAVDSTPFVPAATVAPHSPGEASRRSHAIEIKPPRENATKQGTSILNPKSPTYEPFTDSGPTNSGDPPTPSPAKRSPWRNQEALHLDKHERRALSQKPSLSSIDTQDFFPMNTHEYSSTRVAPRADDLKEASNDKSAVPSTPEKNWPASPWNEGNSGRSRNNEPVSKLTSWPEAFGKQPPHSSFQQGLSSQPSSSMQEQSAITGADTSSSISSGNVLIQTNSDQHTGTDEDHPFSSKAVRHLPSTYQEGYQAGYDHIGIPDIPEVLQGYIQGLLHFLSDEARRIREESAVRDQYLRGIDSRTPSIRGLAAGSTPHDSAVSMTFGRSKPPGGSQENVHSAMGNITNPHRDSAYSLQESTRNNTGAYTLCKEVVQDVRQRNASSAKYLSAAGLFPDRPASEHRQSFFPNAERETGKRVHDNCVPSRADTFVSNGVFGRHFSGNQLNNHTNGIPLPMQRFYPTPNELGPTRFGRDAMPMGRQVTNHRVSGLDGAMDDLAGMVMDTHVDEARTSMGSRFMEAHTPAESEEVGASCFKVSGGKGKQKAVHSPTKASGAGRDSTTCSPANAPSSPKKSGEHSPAKAKLEQVTNKFRRVKKDDVRTMSPEDKKARSQKWRERFQNIRRTELEEIEEYRKTGSRN